MTFRYLFGTTSGDVLFVTAESREDAWERALAEGYTRDELCYHGWANQHLDQIPGQPGVYSTT